MRCRKAILTMVAFAAIVGAVNLDSRRSGSAGGVRHSFLFFVISLKRQKIKKGGEYSRHLRTSGASALRHHPARCVRRRVPTLTQNEIVQPAIFMPAQPTAETA